MDKSTDSFPSSPGDLYLRLAEMVTRRYGSTANKTLREVYHLDTSFFKLDPDDLAFLASNQAAVAALLANPQRLAELVDLFVNFTIEFTYASNQFIHLDSAEEARLRKIYTAYLHDMQAVIAQSSSAEALSNDLSGLLARHFGDLRNNISRFFDPSAGDRVEDNVILNQVACFEYSPAFQLNLLGIRLETLQEPVLDLGCGKSGLLVRYLRAQDVQAVGVDRLAGDEDFMIRSDWLSVKLNPNTWGTVISHMGFTNHFIFHHLYRFGSPEKYARQYKHILDSLQCGGSFYYAPGLPFIEQYLPVASYTVHRRQNRQVEGTSLAENRLVDADVMYVAQVTKRASISSTPR